MNNNYINNLFSFWDDIIINNKEKFSQYNNMIILINDIDNILKRHRTKKLKSHKSSLKHLEDKYELSTPIGNNITCLRSSLPITVHKRSDDLQPTNDTAQDSNSLKNKDILKSQEKEEKENDDEKPECNFLKNRMLSSKVIFNEDNIRSNKNEEDDKGEGKSFFRFSSKKAATVSINLSKINNLEIKLFNFQEEEADNNFITKTKMSKQLLNFIDIDLFLQYIAIGKNFFENEEENNDLIEGFCLQYQAFIIPENLINKIISCFSYFYDGHQNKDNNIIEEKKEEDDDSFLSGDSDEEKNESGIEKKKKTLKKKKSIFEEEKKKVPYGLINFIYTFISLHNIYFHNELSQEMISKLFGFLQKLRDIEQLEEQYKQKIELSEIELKEYESSIKTFSPISTKNLEEDKSEQISLDDELYSDEEKDIVIENDDKKDKTKILGNNKIKSEMDIKKTLTLNNKTNKNINGYGFKLENVKTLNQNNFTKIYEVENQKGINLMNYMTQDPNQIEIKEKKKSKSKKKKKKKDKEEDKERGYEFDILKYKSQDIASELARFKYSLFSKIKVKEFLKGAFNGKDKYKSSPHICEIVKRFNLLSSWVIEEILAYDHAEKRSQILFKFMHICTALKKMGDFDDCLSILTGLTSYNINKLHKTWGHIPSSEMANFRGLKKMLSFEDNWKNLRNELDKKVEEKSFFIPYLGYYTKRMLFLEEMGPYIKKNTSLINIEKIVEVYKVLKSFYQIKNVKNCRYICHDENIKKDLLILQCLEPSNEDFLTETSNLLEPKFILSSKKSNIKRRTKTDINFLNNMNKYNLI